MRRPEQRTPDEQAHVAQRQQHDPMIAQMMRTRTPSALHPWLETVVASAFPDLTRFAAGLQSDAAVHAAFESR